MARTFQTAPPDSLSSDAILRVNVRQLRIKTRWSITSFSFGHIYSFPDLHHIHENSAETLSHKYSIVNLPKNTKYDVSYANIILWLKDEQFC